MYRSGAEGPVMNKHAWHSFSLTSFNNYDSWAKAKWLNETVYEVAEKARVEKMRKKNEEEVKAKLDGSQWAPKEAALKNELAV